MCCVVLSIIADLAVRAQQRDKEATQKGQDGYVGVSEFEALLLPYMQPKLQILEQLFLLRDVTPTPHLRQIVP